MLGILANIFTYLLALYGALILISSAANSIRRRVSFENSDVRLVLIVKNQEKTIEGIIRNIFAGDFLKKVMSAGNLIVLDMGSDDETLKILARLRKDFEYMDVVKEDEKNRVFDCLGETADKEQYSIAVKR